VKPVESAINVTIENGFLRVIGEIPVTCGREEMEDFLSEISLKLLGKKRKTKVPSFGLVKKELTETEAAIYIGRSKFFLRKCRKDGSAGTFQRGPRYTRDSERSIRYPVEELDKWLSSRATYEANCEVISNA
jgi:hypothetical protein